MTIYAFLSLVTFILALAIGIVVFNQSPSGRLHRIFLLLSICIAGWALVEFGYRSSHNYQTALFWNRLDIFWVMTIPLLFHMVMIFTEKNLLLEKRRIQALLYGPAIAFIAVELFTDLITGPPIREYWGWTYSIPTVLPVRFAAMIWTGVFGILSITLLVRYYYTASEARRQGTFLFTSGLLFTLTAAHLSESILPFIGIKIPELTVQSYLLGGALAGSAVWRYQAFRIHPETLTDSIIESMSDGLLVLSADLEVIRVNTAASRLFKRSSGSLIGMFLCNLLQTEPDTPLDRAIACKDMSDTLVDVEGDAILRRGGSCPVSVSISTLPKNRGYICLVRDITERRLAHRELRTIKQSLEEVVAERTQDLIQTNTLLTEEILEHQHTVDELIQSRTRFQELVDLLPEMVYEIDLNGIVTYANQQVFHMTGYSTEDYERGFSALNLIAPEDLDRAKQNMGRVFSGKYNGPTEYTGIRKDGSRFPFMNTSAPIFQNGRVVGIRGVFVDITNRKRIENELLNHERRFREMLENVNMLAGMIRSDGTIEFVNDYFLKVTGWKREELVGQKIIDMTVPPDLREVVGEFYADPDCPVHNEAVVLTAAGEKRLIAWNNTPMYDADGTMIGVSSIGEDITEKRSLEHQFLQAQKMETVGRLAGGIAHDFNNLLTIIMGNAELGLISDGEEASSREYLAEIKQTASRATELTRQLLTFSRRRVTELKPVNINHVLLDMDKMLRRLIGAHIELVVLPADNLDMVLIDPGNLEQVITNLVVNARDAMPEGGTLTISTANTTLDSRLLTRETDLASGAYVSIRVSDTGMGIAPDVQDYLFEPFFTTKEPGKGTGLGLATSYSIVTGLGGSIDVEHTSQHGTRMHVILPRYDGREKPSNRQVAETRHIPAGSETLLIVEDEPSLNRMITNSLSAHGYRILNAANGEEALRIGFEQGWDTIDMLLTDVVMPRMGGHELTQHVHEQNPDIPILYMSGYTDTNGITADIEEGRCEFIQKPFTPAKLGLKIRAMLDSHSLSPDETEQDPLTTT